MKRIPEHLRKEIIRANRKKNRLSKKLIGTTNKITDLNFDHLEVKVPAEKFLDLNDSSICYDEYAYFYDSKNKETFNIEKVKHGKLKEYYERFLNLHIIDNSFAKHFNGRFFDCIDELSRTMTKEDLLAGFYINGIYFYSNYYTVNLKNEITEIYFQSKSPCLLLPNSELTSKVVILRFDINTFTLTKIYTLELYDSSNVYHKKYNGAKSFFKYYTPDEELKLQEVLIVF